MSVTTRSCFPQSGHKTDELGSLPSATPALTQSLETCEIKGLSPFDYSGDTDNPSFPKVEVASGLEQRYRNRSVEKPNLKATGFAGFYYVPFYSKPAIVRIEVSFMQFTWAAEPFDQIAA